MTTKQILRIMYVLAWVVFIGASVVSGAIIFSFFISLFINPEGAGNLYRGLDLSDLYSFSKFHYVNLVLYIIIIAALKAYISYLLVRIFLKLNIVHPFSKNVALLISRISYVALGIGLITLIGSGYVGWLSKKGVAIPPLHDVLGGAGEHLFFGGIIFIISLVFNRGIEIQSENELTI